MPRARAYAKAGLLARAARLSRGQRAALFTSAILLLVTLTAAWLIRERAAGRQELAQAKTAAADWQRQYEERQQTARELEKELQETKQRFAEQHARFETWLDRMRQARTRPADGLSETAQPQTAAPVFTMSTVRSGGEGQFRPVNQIVLSRSPQWVVLSLELEPDPDLQSYRAALLTADDQRIWSASNLQPNSREALALSLNSTLFKPGACLLTLEGLTPQGRYVPVAKYPFRAIRE